MIGIQSILNFFFLPENEIFPHFLQMSRKTFHSFLTERLIAYTHHYD